MGEFVTPTPHRRSANHNHNASERKKRNDEEEKDLDMGEIIKFLIRQVPGEEGVIIPNSGPHRTLGRGTPVRSSYEVRIVTGS